MAGTPAAGPVRPLAWARTATPAALAAVALGLVALGGCAGWPGSGGTAGGPTGTGTPPAASDGPATAPAPALAASAAPPPGAQGRPDPREAEERAEDRATRRLQLSQDRLRGLAGAELAREIALRDPPAAAAEALELALLLAQRAAAQPGAGSDLQRALALVDPVARGNSPERAAARWLQARLADQRRLEEHHERQAQQLREQQRRIEQLTSQIEALRAIERSLSSARPAAPAASAPR